MVDAVKRRKRERASVLGPLSRQFRLLPSDPHATTDIAFRRSSHSIKADLDYVRMHPSLLVACTLVAASLVSAWDETPNQGASSSMAFGYACFRMLTDDLMDPS
jgi:hypothetical protein